MLGEKWWNTTESTNEILREYFGSATGEHSEDTRGILREYLGNIEEVIQALRTY